MRITPVIVLMGQDFIEEFGDDIDRMVAAINNNEDLTAMCEQNGWPPEALAWGQLIRNISAKAGEAD